MAIFEMEFVSTIGALQKKDTVIIPECNRELAKSLHLVAEDPSWTMVKSDKISQWISIHEIKYITDMEIHLHCYYWNRFNDLNLIASIKILLPLSTTLTISAQMAR